MKKALTIIDFEKAENERKEIYLSAFPWDEKVINKKVQCCKCDECTRGIKDKIYLED